MSTIRNLVRFLDPKGDVHFGSLPLLPEGDFTGSVAQLLDGDPFEGSLTYSGNVSTISKLLAPVPCPPLFLCIGLNYAAHAKEASLPLPVEPALFMKPADAYANSYDDIEIPSHAELLDYEGELCIVIKKDCKNVDEEDADKYILGYTVGNDISSRHWQRPPRSGGQFCYAKSFDKFAPLGPSLLCIPAAEVSKLRLTTKVNQEIRQDSPLSDMVFSVPKIVAHLSRGMTLRKGTVIMTGTPAGIAAGIKKPDSPWLKDGDVVEVEISGIGAIRNRMRIHD